MAKNLLLTEKGKQVLEKRRVKQRARTGMTVKEQEWYEHYMIAIYQIGLIPMSEEGWLSRFRKEYPNMKSRP